jgi:hypothetical protein
MSIEGINRYWEAIVFASDLPECPPLCPLPVIITTGESEKAKPFKFRNHKYKEDSINLFKFVELD